MALFLYKLGRWAYRKKWWVLSAWLVILGLVMVGALTFMRPFTNQFSINNSPAIQATELMAEKFPGGGNPTVAASVNLVFQAPEGETLTDPGNMAAMDRVVDHIRGSLGEEGLSGTMRFGNPVEMDRLVREGVMQVSTEGGLPEETARKDADNLAMLSEDRTIGYTTFEFNAPTAMDVTAEQRAAVEEAMQVGRDLGLRVAAGGSGFGDAITIEPLSEVVGIIVAFAVLLITFGSAVAAGLPLVTALIGVGIGIGIIMLTTAVVDLNNVTPTLAIMIGLAVGIDYALFILSRYRSEASRMSREQAAGMAVGTAGSAVVFAATTVIVALAALAVANIEFLTYMGLLAAVTVLFAMLVAVTLIPALLGIAGEKAFALRIPGVGGNRRRKGSRHRASPRRSLGERWARLVHRFPGLVTAGVIIILGVLTVPVTRLEMALPSDTTQNFDTTQRQAAELLKEGFGAGINGPLLLIVDAEKVNPESVALRPYIDAIAGAVPPPEASPAPGMEPAPGSSPSPTPEPAPAPEPAVEGAEPAAPAPAGVTPAPADPLDAARTASYLYITNAIDSMSGVKNAQIVNANEDTHAAQIMVTPFTGPEEQETVAVSHALRERAAELEAATGVTVGLTGLTAAQVDVTEELAKAMPMYLSIVVGLAMVLLLVVFRSIMVPLVASLGFLLSVGGAFGVTVLFWQEGLFGLVDTPAPLISFMPIFLIGVTFGLAMDYQVFLVTRMRERYLALASPRRRTGAAHAVRGADAPLTRVDESTIDGFSQGARVVTAAALIMIAVFVAFINQPLPFIQIFGFALGVGVFFDAFLVRMALVPASMFLLGRATWWMPRWLDRILPHLDVEGEKLETDRINAPEGARS